MNPLNLFYTLRAYVEAYGGFLSRRFLPLVWVVALCVVIWFYGYILSIGGYKPLSSAQNRLLAMGVIVAIWLCYTVYSIIKARRRDKALTETFEEGVNPAAVQQAEVGEIQGRLKEAIALLRRVSKRRFGYIYELPWYVIFGAPGSGKTTALTHSGLKFPLGDALGANSVQGVGGTRSCNWWFTDEAILIDTAGRYTTHDDIGGAAKAGWDGFLELLRKHRRSQPVNGAVVTLSVGDILTRNSTERLEEIRAVRQRLSELDQQLRARVPVYLVLTKADLLTGFVEFFDGFNKTDRDQVWGTTFGLQESQGGANLPDRFVEEFRLLQERVDSMLIERLQQEPDSEIRGRIFRFPAEIASLRDRIHEILTELCTGSKLVETPFLRGIYFASGTQQDEVAPSRNASPRQMSRSYFLTRLFNEVIFGEAALVMHDKRLSGRQLMLRRIAYGTAAGVAVLVFGTWIATYYQNTTALAHANERIGNFQKAVQGVPVRDVADADFLRILPALNDLRDVTGSFDDVRRWSISFGLDQREKIAGRQRDAYHRALNGYLLPRMLVQLRNDLDDTSDVRRTFDTLKLYGMLGGLGPRDADFAARASAELFDRLYPGQGSAATRRDLVQHVRNMVATDMPTMKLDENAIIDARKVIANQSIPARAYDILINSPEARALAQWTPGEPLGPVGEQAFERESKAPLREGVAGLFTGEGFRAIIVPQLEAASQEALDEYWVRGERRNAANTTIDRVAQATLQLYFNNYERAWSELLSDLRVRQAQTIADAAEIMRVLATDPGPIKSLAQSIASTADLRLNKAAQVADGGSVLDIMNDAPTSLPAIAGSISVPDPYGRLRDALQANKQATDDNGGGEGSNEKVSQIDALRPLLSEMYTQLSRAATSGDDVANLFSVNSKLTDATQQLAQASRSLPPPVDMWLAGLTADVGALGVRTARTRINDYWRNGGAEALCTSIVVGRYPFDRSSDRDVTIGDFTRLVGPRGLFATFFKERLQPFVDTGVSPWRWRGSFGTAGPESEALAQFENADKIRQVFFPGGAETPALTINVKPIELSSSARVVQLEVEEQKVFKTEGSPEIARSIEWPSANKRKTSSVAFVPGGQQDALVRSGDWSPFKLFDAASVKDLSADIFRARFSQRGMYADFDVQFGSVLNPFRLKALSELKCPSQF